MRLRMVRPLDETLPDAPPDAAARPVASGDADAIAFLMAEAYRGTPDDEGEGLDGAAAEVRRTLDGAYGPFDFLASEVTCRDGQVVSATLVTEFRGEALIAFSMTLPSWGRRGLARAGLVRTMHRLKAAGRTEVFLAVSEANLTARALYESLGFVERPV